jgi:hypothetical protein
MLDTENKFTRNEMTETLTLPSNCSPLIHQVAGHFFGQTKYGLG